LAFYSGDGDKATANIRIRNMAGRTVSHWADAMLFGFSSSGRKSIEQHIFTETFYLYRALVARRTKP
jgi:hypothetical protein